MTQDEINAVAAKDAEIAALKAELADIAAEWVAAKRIGYELAQGMERKLDRLAAIRAAREGGK